MTGLNERIPVPAADIEAGVARRIIDPPVGIRARNWGPADWNASEGQHRHMTLTAIAFRSPGDEPVVLITADATWWRRRSRTRTDGPTSRCSKATNGAPDRTSSSSLCPAGASGARL